MNDFSNIRFIDLPVKTSLDVYYSAIEKVAQEIRKYPSLSLYLQGGFSAPGISDIDLIVVYPDDDPEMRPKAWALNNPDSYDLSVEERCLFTHGLVIICRSMFSGVKFVYGMAKPKHIAGYICPDVCDYDLNWRLNDLILGLSFLPMRWTELAMLLTAETVSVRKVLTLTHSVCHSIKFLKECGEQCEQWERFSDKTAEFRKIDYSENFSQPLLYSLIEEGEKITRDLMIAYEKQFNELVGGEPVSVASPVSLVNHFRRITYFIDSECIQNFDTCKMIDEWKKQVWYGNLFQPAFSIVPSGFLKHVELLVNNNFPFSGKLATRLSAKYPKMIDKSFNDDYLNLINRRAEFLWKAQEGPLFTNIIANTEGRRNLKGVIQFMAGEILIKFFKPRIIKANEIFLIKLSNEYK